MTDKIYRHDKAYRCCAGSGELTVTPEGVIYGSLSKASHQYGMLVDQYMPDAGECADGVFVYIPRGVKCGLPFELEYVYAKEQLSKTLILLEEGARAEIFIYTDCGTEGGRKARESRMIIVDADAKLAFGELVLTGEGSVFESDSHIRLMAGSELNGVTAELGSGKASLSYNTDLAGENVNCRHSLLFISTEEEQTGVNATVNHLMPDSQSDILIKGVASGNAKGNFKGLVFVAQDAQHTQAYQQSRNLLLSNLARIETSPQLEIYADDVKCSHGATVGQVDDDSLFYMRQRGLSEMQARKLQLKGFVDDVLMHCSDDIWMRNAMRLADQKIETL